MRRSAQCCAWQPQSKELAKLLSRFEKLLKCDEFRVKRGGP